jgi:hypothetical protein
MNENDFHGSTVLVEGSCGDYEDYANLGANAMDMYVLAMPFNSIERSTNSHLGASVTNHSLFNEDRTIDGKTASQDYKDAYKRPLSYYGSTDEQIMLTGYRLFVDLFHQITDSELGIVTPGENTHPAFTKVDASTDINNNYVNARCQQYISKYKQVLSASGVNPATLMPHHGTAKYNVTSIEFLKNLFINMVDTADASVTATGENGRSGGLEALVDCIPGYDSEDIGAITMSQFFDEYRYTTHMSPDTTRTDAFHAAHTSKYPHASAAVGSVSLGNRWRDFVYTYANDQAQDHLIWQWEDRPWNDRLDAWKSLDHVTPSERKQWFKVEDGQDELQYLIGNPLSSIQFHDPTTASSSSDHKFHLYSAAGEDAILDEVHELVNSASYNWHSVCPDQFTHNSTTATCTRAVAITGDSSHLISQLKLDTENEDDWETDCQGVITFGTESGADPVTVTIDVTDRMVSSALNMQWRRKFATECGFLWPVNSIDLDIDIQFHQSEYFADNSSYAQGNCPDGWRFSETRRSGHGSADYCYWTPVNTPCYITVDPLSLTPQQLVQHCVDTYELEAPFIDQVSFDYRDETPAITTFPTDTCRTGMCLDISYDGTEWRLNVMMNQLLCPRDWYYDEDTDLCVWQHYKNHLGTSFYSCCSNDIPGFDTRTTTPIQMFTDCACTYFGEDPIPIPTFLDQFSFLYADMIPPVTGQSTLAPTVGYYDISSGETLTAPKISSRSYQDMLLQTKINGLTFPNPGKEIGDWVDCPSGWTLVGAYCELRQTDTVGHYVDEVMGSFTPRVTNIPNLLVHIKDASGQYIYRTSKTGSNDQSNYGYGTKEQATLFRLPNNNYGSPTDTFAIHEYDLSRSESIANYYMWSKSVQGEEKLVERCCGCANGVDDCKWRISGLEREDELTFHAYLTSLRENKPFRSSAEPAAFSSIGAETTVSNWGIAERMTFEVVDHLNTAGTPIEADGQTPLGSDVDLTLYVQETFQHVNQFLTGIKDESYLLQVDGIPYYHVDAFCNITFPNATLPNATDLCEIGIGYEMILHPETGECVQQTIYRRTPLTDHTSAEFIMETCPKTAEVETMDTSWNTFIEADIDPEYGRLPLCPHKWSYDRRTGACVFKVLDADPLTWFPSDTFGVSVIGCLQSETSYDINVVYEPGRVYYRTGTNRGLVWVQATQSKSVAYDLHRWCGIAYNIDVTSDLAQLENFGLGFLDDQDIDDASLVRAGQLPWSTPFSYIGASPSTITFDIDWNSASLDTISMAKMEAEVTPAVWDASYKPSTEQMTVIANAAFDQMSRRCRHTDYSPLDQDKGLCWSAYMQANVLVVEDVQYSVVFERTNAVPVTTVSKYTHAADTDIVMYDFRDPRLYTPQTPSGTECEQDGDSCGEIHQDLFRFPGDASNGFFGNHFTDWTIDHFGDTRLDVGGKMWSNRLFYSDIDFSQIWTWLTDVSLLSASSPLDVTTQLRGDDRYSKSYCWKNHYRGSLCEDDISVQTPYESQSNPWVGKSSTCEIGHNKYGFDEVSAVSNPPFTPGRCLCLSHFEGNNLDTDHTNFHTYKLPVEGSIFDDQYPFRQIYRIGNGTSVEYGCGCSAFSSDSFPNPDDPNADPDAFLQCKCHDYHGFSGPDCLCQHGFWSGLLDTCICEHGWHGSMCNRLNSTATCVTGSTTLTKFFDGTVLSTDYGVLVDTECNSDQNSDNRCVLGKCQCAEGFSPTDINNPMDCGCSNGKTGALCDVDICPSGPGGVCDGHGTCDKNTGECTCFTSTDDTDWTGGEFTGDACTVPICSQPCPISSGLASCIHDNPSKTIECKCRTSTGVSDELNVFCSATVCPSPRFDAFTSLTDDTDVCSNSQTSHVCNDATTPRTCSPSTSTRYLGQASEIDAFAYCGTGASAICGGDGVCVEIGNTAATVYETGIAPHTFTSVAAHTRTNPSEYYQCSCNDGHTGDKCEVRPCLVLNGKECPTILTSGDVGGNIGDCVVDHNDYTSSTCDCVFTGQVDGETTELFRGDFCDVDVTAECGTKNTGTDVVECGFGFQEDSVLFSHGTCVVNATHAKCECEPGYFGDTCDQQDCACYQDPSNPDHGDIECVTDPNTQVDRCACLGDVFAPVPFNTTLEICLNTCIGNEYVPSNTSEFCECPDPTRVNKRYAIDTGCNSIACDQTLTHEVFTSVTDYDIAHCGSLLEDPGAEIGECTSATGVCNCGSGDYELDAVTGKCVHKWCPHADHTLFAFTSVFGAQYTEDGCCCSTTSNAGYVTEFNLLSYRDAFAADFCYTDASEPTTAFLYDPRDYCASDFCGDHGTLDINTETCTCDDGYIGSFCQVFASCPEPFTGLLCETNSCVNGGTVDVPFSGSTSQADQVCTCTGLWNGDNCELPECVDGNLDTNTSLCVCNSLISSGQHCNIHACGGGFASDPGTGIYECDCVDGSKLSGTQCEIDDCSLQGLMLGSRVIDGAGPGYICSCPAVWGGEFCETSLCIDGTSNGIGSECICNGDATGTFCGALACDNGVYNAISNECDCDTPEWQQPLCAVHSCFDHGQWLTGSGECGCYGPFDTTDFCEMDTCVNGGIATELSVGVWECDCSGTGYEGDDCETEIDECVTDPCESSASNTFICVDQLLNRICVCNDGWEGDDCETSTNECSDFPCQNGATCVDNHLSFVCECPFGFNGTLCENNIDDCIGDALGLCQNNGFCVDGINATTCNCDDTG